MSNISNSSNHTANYAINHIDKREYAYNLLVSYDDIRADLIVLLNNFLSADDNTASPTPTNITRINDCILELKQACQPPAKPVPNTNKLYPALFFHIMMMLDSQSIYHRSH